MIFEPTALAGAVLVHPDRQADERGFFARTWCAQEFAAAALPARAGAVQRVVERSSGTRCAACTGRPPRTARGSWCAARGARSYDVVVDLRPDSSTYLAHLAVRLDQDNRDALFIPRGLAHGFLTLVEGTEVLYQMDTAYVPEAARGARWDDPAFAVRWPARPAVISERDRSYPNFVPERAAARSES